MLVKSFGRLTDIDLGIAFDNVLSMRLDLEAWQYTGIETVTAAHTAILEQVRRSAPAVAGCRDWCSRRECRWR